MLKLLEGYGDKYTLDSLGQVININTGKSLKHSLNQKVGYLQVSLWHQNKPKTLYLHRLLAQTFIPNPENRPQVNHIDGNKLNNALDNLEWVTVSENAIHACAVGLSKRPRKFTPEVYALMLESFLEGELSMKEIASKYEVSLSAISGKLRGLAVELGKEELFNQVVSQRYSKVRKNLMKHTQQCVKQFTLEGGFIQEHASLRDAARSLGKNSSGPITNMLKGRAATAYGYKWERV